MKSRTPVPPEDTWPQLPASRADAQRTGSHWFFNDQPCKHGHVAPRWAGNSRCTVCHRERVRKRRRERMRERGTEEYRTGEASRVRQFRREHIEDIGTEHYHAERARSRRDSYRRDPEKYRALARQRHAEGRKARTLRQARTPPWQSKEEREAIKRFYADCPDGVTVDHVIPLLNPVLSGLHVVGNLQYLTPYRNNLKGNRLPLPGDFTRAAKRPLTDDELRWFLNRAMGIKTEDLTGGRVDWSRVFGTLAGTYST